MKVPDLSGYCDCIKQIIFIQRVIFWKFENIPRVRGHGTITIFSRGVFIIGVSLKLAISFSKSLNSWSTSDTTPEINAKSPFLSPFSLPSQKLIWKNYKKQLWIRKCLAFGNLQAMFSFCYCQREIEWQKFPKSI